MVIARISCFIGVVRSKSDFSENSMFVNEFRLALSSVVDC